MVGEGHEEVESGESCGKGYDGKADGGVSFEFINEFDIWIEIHFERKGAEFVRENEEYGEVGDNSEGKEGAVEEA